MKTQTITRTAGVRQEGPGKKNAPGRDAVSHTLSSSTMAGGNVTSSSRHQREEIAALAYKIWQQQGCPVGCEEQHWRQAEQEYSHADTHTLTP
ncbi:DUF2934 domain-containing protein [Prosthecobacter sp.]|uniref:DUF2934 domain-containing protein n=1 Tax=Prosthecobacter sp. TaxID=1965333 RepID=UPI003783E69F